MKKVNSTPKSELHHNVQPIHESIDFIGIAKMERENHNDRLIKWIEKRGGDMKREKYFIKDQLEQIEVDLSERNQFTVGPIWDQYVFERLDYKEFLQNRLKELDQAGTQSTPPQPIIESPFSVLEWATIFYYADETKLLSESRLLKTRLEQFMSKHQVNTTPVHFKNSYYEAKRRINEKNDYPINKLELIIPFLKENYKQTVTKVENDIIFLEENKPEY